MMPIDTRRVIRAAVEAALEDPVPKPRRKRRILRARTLLVGAGLMTAGRLATSSRGREIFGEIGQRVADFEDRFLGADEDLPEDEAELDEQEELDADDLDEGELEEDQGLGEGEDEELDEEEPEPELEEEQPPSRKAPARRSRGRR